MANSYVEYAGNGSTSNFAVTFDYIDKNHVKVFVDGIERAFSWANSSTVTISPAPVSGAYVKIVRSSSPTQRLVDYQTPSILSEEVLDMDSKQAFFLGQEAVDRAEESMTRSLEDGHWDVLNRRVKNVADPVDGGDAVNRAWAESGMSSQLAQATAARNAAQVAQAAAEAAEADAASSASSALASKNAAASSASASAGSASAAAASEAASASSASSAASSANSALSYRNSALTYKTNAATSAANAAASEQSAYAHLVSIEDVYLGASASPPTQDKHGGPVQNGDWYIDTTLGYARAYVNGSWVELGTASVQSVDAIQEATPGQGILIDGYLIKDGHFHGSCDSADTLAGFLSSVPADPHTVALRNVNGDIYARYFVGSHINVDHQVTTRNTDTVFFSSSDGYIRKNSAAGFRTSLGLGTAALADLDNLGNIYTGTVYTGRFILRNGTTSDYTVLASSTNSGDLGPNVVLYGPDGARVGRLRDHATNALSWTGSSVVLHLPSSVLAALQVGEVIEGSNYRDGVYLRNDVGQVFIQQQNSRSNANNAVKLLHGTTVAVSMNYAGRIETIGSVVAGGSFSSSYNGTGATFYSGADGGSPSFHMRAYYGGTENLRIYGASGQIMNSNGVYGTLSDPAWKQDFERATSQWEDVKTLSRNMVKFRLKEDVKRFGDDAKVLLGFVTRDVDLPDGSTVTGVRSISPRLVSDDEAEITQEDGTTATVRQDWLATSIVNMKAVKALGEALERIEALEARLAALEPAA